MSGNFFEVDWNFFFFSTFPFVSCLFMIPPNNYYGACGYGVLSFVSFGRVSFFFFFHRWPRHGQNRFYSPGHTYFMADVPLLTTLTCMYIHIDLEDCIIPLMACYDLPSIIIIVTIGDVH